MGVVQQTRRRRTKNQVAAFEAAIIATLTQDNPMSLRGLYYQLVVQGVIEKTEAAYKVLAARTVDMRLQGRLPFHWLADGTRWMRKPRTHDSLRDCLESTAQTYRRSLWMNQAQRLRQIVRDHIEQNAEQENASFVTDTLSDWGDAGRPRSCSS